MSIPNNNQLATNACNAGYVKTEADFHSDRKQSQAHVKKLGTTHTELAAHLRHLIKQANNTPQIEYDPAKSIPNSTLKVEHYTPETSSPKKKWQSIALRIGAMVAMVLGVVCFSIPAAGAAATALIIGGAALMVLGIVGNIFGALLVKKQEQQTQTNTHLKRVEGQKNLITISSQNGEAIPDLLGEKLNTPNPKKVTLINHRSGVSISLQEQEISTIDKIGFYGFCRHGSSPENVLRLYSVLTGTPIELLRLRSQG